MAIKRKTQNLVTLVFFSGKSPFVCIALDFIIFFTSGKNLPKEKIAESDPLVIPEIVEIDFVVFGY
jgi:hypothetical protein